MHGSAAKRLQLGALCCVVGRRCALKHTAAVVAREVPRDARLASECCGVMMPSLSLICVTLWVCSLPPAFRDAVLQHGLTALEPSSSSSNDVQRGARCGGCPFCCWCWQSWPCLACGCLCLCGHPCSRWWWFGSCGNLTHSSCHRVVCVDYDWCLICFFQRSPCPPRCR